MECEAVKYSENSAKPEADFEPKWAKSFSEEFYQEKLC